MKTPPSSLPRSALAPMVWILAAFLLSPAALPAEKEGNPAEVTVIFSASGGPYDEAWEGFRSALQEQGLTVRDARYNLKEQSPEQVFLSLRRDKPRLVLALGSPAAQLAKDKLPGVPTVFCLVLDPKRFEAAHMTGVGMDIPLEAKLAKLSPLASELKKIGILRTDQVPPISKELFRVSKSLGFDVIEQTVPSEKEFPEALQSFLWRVDLFVMVPDAKLYSARTSHHLLEESLRRRVPVLGLSAAYAKAGAFIAFDCDYEELGRQAGEIAARLLRGARPSDIPPVGPRKIHYVMNKAAARLVDLPLPEEILRGAREVFGQ